MQWAVIAVMNDRPDCPLPTAHCQLQTIHMNNLRIFLIGFMGAGKTYWGKQLAEHWDLPYYDLDEVIVAEEEMAVSDIFSTKGEDYFRERESAILRGLVKQERFLISCGGGTPCFQDNMDFMNENGTTI